MNAEQKQIRKARGILDHANSCDSNKLALAGETTEWSSLNTFEVDIFALQIYGLIVCRGSVEDKAGELFDLITKGTKKKEPMVTWAHPRFLKAMKLLVTFSEVMPKKYILMAKKNGNINFKDDKKDKLNKSHVGVQDWDENYLNDLEETFSPVFDIIFDQLIDRIFKNNVN